MIKIPQKFYNVIGTIILGIGLFGLGIYIGHAQVIQINGIANTDVPSTITDVDFAPFWKAWQVLEEKSPDASKISNQDRVWGAISGLAGSFGDPYTTFFPPEDKKSFEATIAGEFGGIGIEIGRKDDVLTVIAPIKDTPAFKAGIQAGDKIIKIDDKSTNGMSIDEAVSLIRGEVGTSVVLTIFHEGDDATKDLTLIRGSIEIPTIKAEKRSDGIFIVSLYNFSSNSAQLFSNAMREFKNSGSDKLILDLRGNPGGYLEASVQMASFFLEKGVVVVQEGSEEKKDEKVHRSNGYKLFTKNPKMVILVDSGSASASEILAGALQEHKVATLVGTQTYGKGSVQELIDITNDTALKVTIAKWYTPNGVSISKEGLTPDVKVEFTKEAAEKKIDPQMDKAVEILNKK